MESEKTTTEASRDDRPRRVIKRYSNRKLYDTRDSRYVTLQQIGEMVRTGEEVQIIDNATKEDKTEVTLALILSDNLRAQPRSVPLAALRDLIQERGTKLLETLREGPIGRLLPGEAKKGEADEVVEAPQPASAPPPSVAPPEPPAAAPPSAATAATPGDRPSRTRFGEFVESSRQTLDEWQHTFEERIKGLDERVRVSVSGGAKNVKDLETELTQLRERVEALERALAAKKS